MKEKKEIKIPRINSLGPLQIKNLDNPKTQYYQKYLNKQIKLRDIPANMLSTQILLIAIKEEPEEFIDIIFNLVKNKVINTSLGEYVQMLPSKYKNQELYNKLFSIKPENYYVFIPKEYKTKEMAEELVRINPNNVRMILAEHRTKDMLLDKEESIDKFWLLVRTPKQEQTKELCETAFLEKKESFKYINDDLKTEKMCLEAVIYNPKMFKLVPSHLLTNEICERTIDSGKEIHYELFELIPEKFQTQEMCQKVFDQYKETFRIIRDDLKTEKMCLEAIIYDPKMFELVPPHLITQEMCQKIIDSGKKIHPEIFKLIPTKIQTQEMCQKVFDQDKEIFRYIKDEFKTEEMCIKMIKADFIENSKYIPKQLFTPEIISIVAFRLKELINRRKRIKLDAEIFKIIITIYPKLTKAFDSTVLDSVVMLDFEKILTGELTVNDIAKKYDVDIELIENRILKLKEKNSELYNKIVNYLNTKKEIQKTDILNDILILEKIIFSLNLVKGKYLDIEQKQKFAYLCGKYLHNKLEEIYRYDYSKYPGFEKNITKKFLEDNLKFRNIYKGGIDYSHGPASGLHTTLVNNSWFNDYDKNEFFGIKNGVPTTYNKYGADAKLLTLDEEKIIVELLKAEDIPLKEILVKGAFKAYYDNTIFEYIYKLKSYDEEFEKISKKGRK